MEPEEFSRVIGSILGSTGVTWGERNKINAAMGTVDSPEDFPDDVKQILAKLLSSTSKQSRASQLSTVERRIIKSNNICERCRLNNDPNNVPVHPNCDCNVVTDSITTGVANPASRFLESLTRDSIDIEVVNGELESAGIQLEPGSVAIMDVENVRFGDLARWLESVQPYLDAGANYVSIVIDDDTEEAIAQVQEAVEAIAEDSEQIIEAIQNRKLWFSIAKAVAL